jgi:hypothetical protein
MATFRVDTRRRPRCPGFGLVRLGVDAHHDSRPGRGSAVAGRTDTTNGPAHCLGCLPRHPEVAFADRVKAHRLAAELPLMDLAERVGVPRQ